MGQGSLAFDDDPVGTLGGVAHHPLGGAGNEVGDDRVDADALACDRDAGLARRNEGRSIAGAINGRYESAMRPPAAAVPMSRTSAPSATASSTVATTGTPAPMPTCRAASVPAFVESTTATTGYGA